MKGSQFLKKKQKTVIKKAKPKKRLFVKHVKVAEKQKSGELGLFKKVIAAIKPNSPTRDDKKSPAPPPDLSTEGKKSSFLKKYKTDLGLFLVPLILFVIFLTLQFVNNNITQNIEKNALVPDSSLTKINEYPFVKKIQVPTVSAKAAIIVDADSQVMLFSKNAKLRFPMASTTKIMTALTGFEYYRDDSVLTVLRSGVEGSVLGLLPGERFTFEDLLYAMLLPSANDAAYVIADNYPGGVTAFVAKMNEKARLLHLTNTHFSDPTGLDDDGDYTTVVDMARLATHAIKNEKFRAITATKEKLIATVDFTNQYQLVNLNKLLGIDGVNGIKTGTTEGAGEVLVTSTVQNGHTFIVVVMNSEQRFVDTQTLISFIKQNVQYVSPIFNSALNN